MVQSLARNLDANALPIPRMDMDRLAFHDDSRQDRPDRMTLADRKRPAALIDLLRFRLIAQAMEDRGRDVTWGEWAVGREGLVKISPDFSNVAEAQMKEFVSHRLPGIGFGTQQFHKQLIEQFNRSGRFEQRGEPARAMHGDK